MTKRFSAKHYEQPDEYIWTLRKISVTVSFSLCQSCLNALHVLIGVGVRCGVGVADLFVTMSLYLILFTYAHAHV